MPPWGGIPAMFHQEEAQRRTPNTLEGLFIYLSQLIWGCIGVPPTELEDVCVERGGLGISGSTAAPVTRLCIG